MVFLHQKDESNRFCPALLNKNLLAAERDKYGSNDIKPGLIGWVQINRRDELEIPVNAQLDG